MAHSPPLRGSSPECCDSMLANAMTDADGSFGIRKKRLTDPLIVSGAAFLAAADGRLGYAQPSEPNQTWPASLIHSPSSCPLRRLEPSGSAPLRDSDLRLLHFVVCV